jgi:hypothetical protein
MPAAIGNVVNHWQRRQKSSAPDFTNPRATGEAVAAVAGQAISLEQTVAQACKVGTRCAGASLGPGLCESGR